MGGRGRKKVARLQREAFLVSRPLTLRSSFRFRFQLEKRSQERCRWDSSNGFSRRCVLVSFSLLSLFPSRRLSLPSSPSNDPQTKLTFPLLSTNIFHLLPPSRPSQTKPKPAPSPSPSVSTAHKPSSYPSHSHSHSQPPSQPASTSSAPTQYAYSRPSAPPPKYSTTTYLIPDPLLNRPPFLALKPRHWGLGRRMIKGVGGVSWGVGAWMGEWPEGEGVLMKEKERALRLGPSHGMGGGGWEQHGSGRSVAFGFGWIKRRRRRRNARRCCPCFCCCCCFGSVSTFISASAPGNSRIS
ncbi:hypothetical protein BDY24DRAFT_118913 [Mrakia frigida]|uniref:uncharacterized protein n=1 Tax=Mrakia frigida TaxID=29902 RepID=UPI003FCC1043